MSRPQLSAHSACATQRKLTTATASSPSWQTVLELFVEGDAAPQGSKKLVRSKSGKTLMIESSKKVKPWREQVDAECKKLWLSRPAIDGPIRLVVEFVRPRPKSTPKRFTPPAAKMPDLSKLVRSTEDAITTAGVWKDDARVVELVATKRLAEIDETPGAQIQIQVPA